MNIWFREPERDPEKENPIEIDGDTPPPLERPCPNSDPRYPVEKIEVPSLPVPKDPEDV